MLVNIYKTTDYGVLFAPLRSGFEPHIYLSGVSASWRLFCF